MLGTLDPESPIRGLATELQRQLETRRDLIADTRLVSLAGGNETSPFVALVDLPEGATDFTVNKHAHGQIATHLGVPQKLYDRLLGDHPDLLADLANGLLAREPSKRMLRTMDGKLRAFLSDRYRPRDNWDLLNKAVLPVLEEYPGQVEFKKCDLTDTRLYVKIVLPDFSRPVTPKVGDTIRGGVIIQNSEVGSGSLGIFPYTDRLFCTNGMVHTEFGQRSRHVGGRITGDGNEEAWEFFTDATLKLDDDAFFAKCKDTLRSVMNETVFDAIVSQMRDLADIRVAGAPDKVVEVFAAKHDLTDVEGGSMLEKLVLGADLSGWGYVNALTETARDVENADRQVELETLAGRLVSDQAWALAAA